jgi:hypothetical protein
MTISSDEIDADKEYQRLVNNLELEEDGAVLARYINQILTNDNSDLLKLYLTQAHQETERLRATPKLSDKESAVLQVVTDASDPLTAGDVADRIETDYPDYAEAYKSLTHRTHVSKTLNRLVAKAKLGKLRHKKTVFFVTPKEAVRHWKQRHGYETEISVDKITEELVEETGLPVGTAQQLLKEIA